MTHLRCLEYDACGHSTRTALSTAGFRSKHFGAKFADNSALNLPPIDSSHRLLCIPFEAYKHLAVSPRSIRAPRPQPNPPQLRSTRYNHPIGSRKTPLNHLHGITLQKANIQSKIYRESHTLVSTSHSLPHHPFTVQSTLLAPLKSSTFNMSTPSLTNTLHT